MSNRQDKQVTLVLSIFVYSEHISALGVHVWGKDKTVNAHFQYAVIKKYTNFSFKKDFVCFSACNHSYSTVFIQLRLNPGKVDAIKYIKCKLNLNVLPTMINMSKWLVNNFLKKKNNKIRWRKSYICYFHFNMDLDWLLFYSQ